MNFIGSRDPRSAAGADLRMDPDAAEFVPGAEPPKPPLTERERAERNDRLARLARAAMFQTHDGADQLCGYVGCNSKHLVKSWRGNFCHLHRNVLQSMRQELQRFKAEHGLEDSDEPTWPSREVARQEAGLRLFEIRMRKTPCTAHLARYRLAWAYGNGKAALPRGFE